MFKKVDALPEAKKAEIMKDIDACYASRPKLAMVDSNRGITNLHVPSDVITDASMPAMIRGMEAEGMQAATWTGSVFMDLGGEVGADPDHRKDESLADKWAKLQKNIQHHPGKSLSARSTLI